LNAERLPTHEIDLGLAEIESGESGESRQHSYDYTEAYCILSRYRGVKISNNAYLVKPGATTFPQEKLNIIRQRLIYNFLSFCIFSADSRDQADYRFTEL
jgi:hypothetical protein